MVQFKAVLNGIINVVVNSGIIAIVPPDYKVWVLLAFNLVQVLYMYFDPTYAFRKLGMTKEQYLGAIKK